MTEPIQASSSAANMEMAGSPSATPTRVHVKTASIPEAAADDPTKSVTGRPGQGAAPAASEGRERWPSHTSFLLAAAGAAIGLGNVVRFPYVAEANGGGAFLIPYVLAVVLLGIPVLLLEFGLGQHFQRGVVDAFKFIRPSLSGIGVVMVAGSYLTVTYYNCLMSYSLRYLYDSFQSDLPWAGEGGAQHYFDHEILQLPTFPDEPGRDPSIEDTSRLVGWNVLAVSVAWLMTFGAVHAGVKSSSKVVWVTVPLPFVLLFVLLIRGVTLEGAGAGIEFYLKPDFSKLSEPRVWTSAVSQIFYSISVASGVMGGFASFNDRKNNFWRDTLLVGITNSMTSIVAGFAVFSTLGHMAHEKGVDVEDVARGGLSLAFVAFPEALAELPAAPFFSVCFFFMLLTLGIDSSFALVEAVVTVLKDAYGARHEKALAAGVCASGFLVSLLYVTDAGLFWIDLVDHFVATYLLLPVGLAELVAVAWVYGAKRFTDAMKADTGVALSDRWVYVWKYVAPVLILVAFFVAMVDDMRNPLPDAFGNQYPTWAYVLGFFVALSPTVYAVAWGVREEFVLSRAKTAPASSAV